MNSYTYLFSIAVFISSFYIFSKCSASKVNRLIFSLIAFSYIFLCIAYEVADYFTGNGIDYATIIQIKFGFRGAAFGAYIWLIALTSVILFASVVIFSVFIFKESPTKTDGSFKKCFFPYSFLLVALLANPASINGYNLPKGTFIPSRASSESSIAEFYKYYKKPKLQSLSAEPKNIVFIYLESFERAFFNEDVFPDLVPKLKEIEKESISFTNMHMADGTGGTIWAISASQCGLPLFLPSLAILNHGTKDFLPSATCLGDLLKDEGYYLTYYGGASLEFTGKGKFFNTHGFADVFGKNELIPKLENKEYLNFWGLYDDSLFDITYKRFLELSALKEKFGIFLLTVDTHSPGYASKSCENIPYKSGESEHLNAVACSDYLISDFITKIVNSPYASQTVIVLASDHLNWNDVPTIDLLEKARDGKKNTFMIIEPGVSKGGEVTTRGTAFDIGTTILPFIGYSGQIGLGRDLLKQNTETEEEIAYIQTMLHAWKSEILKFWRQPKIRRSVSIDISDNTILIDKKEYKIPILIELNDELDSTLLFGFNGTFEQHLQKMSPSKRFLMVGECKYIKTSGKMISDNGVAIADDGWCLITGKGKEYVFKTKLNSDVDYNIHELEEILNGYNDSPPLSGGNK